MAIDPFAAALRDAAQTLKPQTGAARRHYEAGLSCAARGDDTGAIAAFRQATALNPAMSAAWRRLGDALIRGGNRADADAAYTAYLRAASDDAELMRAATALLDGKLDVAGRLLRARIRHAPNDVAALRLLAEACMGLGRYAEAQTLLERTLDLAPGFAAARHNYAIVLFRQDKADLAIPQLERLLAQEPGHAGYRTLLASCAATVGAYDRAIAIYQGVIKDTPKQPTLWLSYARALRHAGRREESARAYRACLDVAPATGEAWLGLVDVAGGPPAAADVAAMRALIGKRDVSAADRVFLHYALGHALERAGEYADAFAHYADGAKLRRGEIAYSADENAAQVRRTIEFFTPAFLADRAGWGCRDPAPIFILGLPRAGSTLIEQILASHSDVEGTRELPEIIHIATDLANPTGGTPYPACLSALNEGEITALGERYIHRTRPYRKTGKTFFVDKQPANWMHVGLIHLILPRAKIIDARRDPMAACFSAFRQCFAGAQNFSYDLGELGRYYNDYAGLMSHFDTVLPGRVHRVIYEDMVADTEGEIRRLLAYCELPFDAGCLRFWENRRAVTTASADQVRQPIFREGLDQWRKFAPWLGPLRDALR